MKFTLLHIYIHHDTHTVDAPNPHAALRFIAPLETLTWHLSTEPTTTPATLLKPPDPHHPNLTTELWIAYKLE